MDTNLQWWTSAVFMLLLFSWADVIGVKTQKKVTLKLTCCLRNINWWTLFAIELTLGFLCVGLISELFPGSLGNKTNNYPFISGLLTGLAGFFISVPLLSQLIITFGHSQITPGFVMNELRKYAKMEAWHLSIEDDNNQTRHNSPIIQVAE